MSTSILGDVWFFARSGLEILILWAVLYWLLRSLDRISAGGKMRGLSIGIGVLALSWFAARFMELHAISWLLQASLGFLAVVLIVVLQPELRRLFSRLGGALPALDHGAAGDEQTIRTLVDAAARMSAARIGGLIVIERRDHLDDLITGHGFDCDLSVDSLSTVFWKDSPLHDGAVIVRRGRIAAAGVVLPLTSSPAHAKLNGTRHRAGLGISEETDALAIIISEETGAISVADQGELASRLAPRELDELLRRVFRASSPISSRHATVSFRRP